MAERIAELRQAVESLSLEAARRERTISPMAEQYRSLFEAGSEGYIVHDNGTIIEVNPQFEELLGYKSSELVGESVMKLVAEESKALVAERLRTPLRKPFEVEGLRKDGTRVQVELLGKEHVHDGRAVGLVTVHDITEAKKAREALRESEARYRDYYENAPDAYLSVDLAEGLLIECNQTAADMLGRDKDEMIGHKIFEFYAPESSERVHAALQELSAEGVLRGVKLKIHHKDGTLIDVSLDATAVKDKSGRVVRSRSVWRDITKRAQAEQALRESETWLKAAEAAGGIGTFDWDIEHDTATCSDQYFRLFGVEPSPGVSLEEFLKQVHAEDVKGVQKAVADTLGRGALYAMEYRVIWPDGSVHWIGDRAEVVKDDKGRPVRFLGAIADITKRKRLEEELQQAREELEGKVEREMEGENVYKLTFREFTVLHHLTEGEADKEIAAKLGISPFTVNKHVSNILAKMKAASRTEASIRAVREALVN